jgi:hypothetical protein
MLEYLLSPEFVEKYVFPVVFAFAAVVILLDAFYWRPF